MEWRHIAMSRKRSAPSILSLLHIVLGLLILVHSGAGFSSNNGPSNLNIVIPRTSRSVSVKCNGSCIKNSTACDIQPGFCYIEGKCYDANQTRLNGSLSCLQCQPDKDQWNWSFNKECSPAEKCVNQISLGRNLCPANIIKAFYIKPTDAIFTFYNFEACSRDKNRCQEGFFISVYDNKTYACCPGFFCPEGQICMIPCRQGGYCPGQLSARNGTCRTPVKCPEYQPMEYGTFGCGGSYFEGFCPNGMYCPTPAQSIPCKSATKFCPTGVTIALSCPLQFVCTEGRTERPSIVICVCIIVFVIYVLVVIFVLPIFAKLFKWMSSKKKWFREHKLIDPPGVSPYFIKAPGPDYRPQNCIELHIHLEEARLRDVKPFDPEQNKGFTGNIASGNITALMGGSGCGKSSLLETIYGRRQLRPNGSITFANHKPLSNILTHYVGYVPQADIMHNDLTVFETVYYSARARRLEDSKQTLINDVCFVLEKLGLGNMHDDFIKTLSGGQRKRVNVALEVVACPKVLLLDEPTSGLDTVACDALFDLLQLIKRSVAGPVTIVTVIHQPSHELFEKIDEIFFLTPKCCLAYQGPRAGAEQRLRENIVCDLPPRHNDCDTYFVILSTAEEHIDNHGRDPERTTESLKKNSCFQQALYPFCYVICRSTRQIYLRGIVAEAAYMSAYFLLAS
ncbi:unnamed protein product [Adineta steineri]|uniref:ABC transporter domain-containing protein n=1 Tax=Adineta steineri TaxID=433720 RepID=A0A814BT88_9BILA|nr:unnamed protein product [Adineta steineri]CAF3964707.1 unnamed protein product [Adineta steineri]